MPTTSLLDSLKIAATQPSNGSLKYPSHRPIRKRNERFLRGPISMPWLWAAMSLPGKALHVGIQLWHLSGLTQKPIVKLSLRDLEQRSGVSISSSRRGLKSLANAGLVRVDQKPGRCPRVTLIELKNEQNEDELTNLSFG